MKPLDLIKYLFLLLIIFAFSPGKEKPRFGYDIVYMGAENGIFRYSDSSQRSWQMVYLNQEFYYAGLEWCYGFNDSLLLEYYQAAFEPGIKNGRYFDTNGLRDTVFGEKIFHDTIYVYPSFVRTFFHYDLSRDKNFRVKREEHYTTYPDTQKVITRYFNVSGQEISRHDTIYICRNGESESKVIGETICNRNFTSRSQSVSGVYVASINGDLYLHKDNSYTLLLKSHMGISVLGYLGPSISPDGKKVIFLSNGTFSQPSGIMELDLETGKTTVLLEGTFGRPVYSPDGQHFLVSKISERENTHDRKYEIYVYTANGKKGYLIGEGSGAIWVDK